MKPKERTGPSLVDGVRRLLDAEGIPHWRLPTPKEPAPHGRSMTFRFCQFAPIGQPHLQGIAGDGRLIAIYLPESGKLTLAQESWAQVAAGRNAVVVLASTVRQVREALQEAGVLAEPKR
jgi:hypothetical protein